MHSHKLKYCPQALAQLSAAAAANEQFVYTKVKFKQDESLIYLCGLKRSMRSRKQTIGCSAAAETGPRRSPAVHICPPGWKPFPQTLIQYEEHL